MDHLLVGGRRYALDRATADDVPALVDLLSDDALGSARESRELAPYLAAFRDIDQDHDSCCWDPRRAEDVSLPERVPTAGNLSADPWNALARNLLLHSAVNSSKRPTVAS